MKLLLHEPFYLFFFLFLFFSLFYFAAVAPATPITTNANDEVVMIQTQPFERPVEGAPQDTMSNALKSEEKHRPKRLKNVGEERQRLSVKNSPYFFRVTRDSSQSKKKVLVAFIPSKKRSLMAFVKEIIRQIFKALPYPLSSKIFNASNPNDISTRAAPVPSFNDGTVHEIFNMMGCKKEIAVKDASSNSSLESRMVCILVRLIPTLCPSALLFCLPSLLHPQWMGNWLFPLAFCLASFCFTVGADFLFESCPVLPSSQVFNYIFKGGMSLLAAAYMITMRTRSQHEMQETEIKETGPVLPSSKVFNYIFKGGMSLLADAYMITMRTRSQHELQETERKEPGMIGKEEEAAEEEEARKYQKEKEEEIPVEDKAGESSNMAYLRTKHHQRPHTYELDGNQGNLSTSTNLITSYSASTIPHQDNEVSSTISTELENFPDQMLTGHQRRFYQFGIYTFTSQRNCLRFFWLFVLITTIVIVITIYYIPRGNFIISTPKLELSASKETQEFIQHRSGSKVLLPTRNDMYTKGKEKELQIARPTEHVGSLRESTVITSSSNTDVKLRIVVPIKKGFHEFIKISSDPKNNHALITGFVIDVFNEVMKTLPTQVSWEFIPYEASYKDTTGYYDTLAHQINLKSQDQSYDAVVGDVTITAKRSKYGVFSSPFLSSGISMIVPIEDDSDVNHLWWFFKPLSAEMWIVIFVFFLLKGVLLWLFEHKTDQDFQLGNLMSYYISTSIQRGNLERRSSKFIVDLWTISLFIIGAAYSANLSMLLTNGTPQVTNTDLETLIENGDNVGYPNGSFVFELLKQWGFHESKLKAYSTEKEYLKALSLGSAKNGVSAIVDEIPYIRVFLTRYGHRYAMGGINRMIPGSFGFVFPKASKMVSDISEAILQLQEVGRITEISEKWFEPLACSGSPIQAPGSFKKMGFHQFRGLFLITGLATCAALLLPLLTRCYQEKKDVIIPQWQNIKAWLSSSLASLTNMVLPT